MDDLRESPSFGAIPAGQLLGGETPHRIAQQSRCLPVLGDAVLPDFFRWFDKGEFPGRESRVVAHEALLFVLWGRPCRGIPISLRNHTWRSTVVHMRNGRQLSAIPRISS